MLFPQDEVSEDVRVAFHDTDSDTDTDFIARMYRRVSCESESVSASASWNADLTA